MTEVRYAPGDGLIVIGDAFAMILPEGHEQTAREVWASIDGAEDPVLAALDVVAGGGLADMPDFACVHWSSEATSGAVRGDRNVNADGEHWSGTDARTWTEHRRGGAPVALSVADAADARLRCGGGIVRGVGFTVTREGGRAPSALPGTAGPQTIVGPAPEGLAEPVPGPSVAGLISVPAADVPAEAPVAAPVVVEEPVDDFDALFGHTVTRSPEDAAIRGESGPAPEDDADAGSEEDLHGRAAPEPVDAASTPEEVPGVDALLSAASGDHDGHTVARPVIAAGDRPPASVALQLSTGRTVLVDAVLLIGREPDPTGHQGAVVRTIEIPGRHRDLSRTHLEVRPAADGLIVRDLSANGTAVAFPGQPVRRVPPRTDMPVPVGAVIELCDDVTIRVERAG